MKRNQPKLQDAIIAQSETEPPVQKQVEDDKSRGRNIQRVVEVFTPPANIDPSWQKVLSVIRVTRSGERDGKAFKTLSYYISSLPPNSSRLAKSIRQHWHIENRLHWVKDVIFDEDKSKQKAGNAPINFSTMKTWVLSLYRLHGFDSIKGAIEQFSHNLTAILSLLT